MRDDAITITIPMTPDRRLTPNKRGYENRWSRAPMIAAERQKGHALTREALYSWDAINDPVTVTVTIHWGKSMKAGKVRSRVEQDRRLDWDSATSLVKPMLDGVLVDTGILNDDRQIQWGTVKQEIDPAGDGYTVIRIEPADRDSAEGGVR